MKEWTKEQKLAIAADLATVCRLQAMFPDIDALLADARVSKHHHQSRGLLS